jgi:integrase
MPKITKRFVDTLEPGPRKAFYWDDTLKGLGVCVTAASPRYPLGRRTYVVQYRVRGSGRSRRLTLGATNVLSAYQARERAFRALAEAATGNDPSPPREDDGEPEPEVPTLRSFAAHYLREHAQRAKKSWAADQDYLDRLILPALGDRLLEEIAREDVERIHQKVGACTPVQANRVLALVSVIFSKAVEWKVLSAGHENPTVHVTPFPEQKRRRFLSIEELMRLGKVLEQLEAETGKWKGPRNIADRLDSVALIRLSILTACRKSELTKLRKDEIDREWNVLRLTESKTGPKVVELPSPALAVLDRVEERSDNKGSLYVFPGRDPSKPRGEPRRLWDHARKRAGIEDVHLHDLRRTYASLAANVNVPPPVLQGLLGHTKYETTEVYVQLFDRKRATSAQRVASLAEAVLEGRPDAEVIELRQKHEDSA